MSRNIQTVTKWLPSDLQELEKVFESCRQFKRTSHNLLLRIRSTLENFKSKNISKIHHTSPEIELNIQELEDINSTLNVVATNLGNIFQNLNLDHSAHIIVDKISLWKTVLWKIKLKMCYYLHELLTETAYLFIYYQDTYLTLTLKISMVYNNLLAMDAKFGLDKELVVCNNTCPYLLFPFRKISITRLLQILASNRAELCCHKLIDCLLETYKLYEAQDDDNGSDNSSIEIYRALTQHMSPRESIDLTNEKTENNGKNNVNNSGSFVSIAELISYEEKNVLDLLEVVLKVCPSMLGNDGYKKTRHDGLKIRPKAREKVLEYYEQILWGEVGNFLEHIILWWAASPLSARSPHSSQHLREWITQFMPSADVPPVVLSALSSLADGLGVHVTSTSWDQNFRLALVAAKTPCNPDTGKLFCNLLQDLVVMSNQCELTPDWIVGAPLDELPLVEQIPVLHRLDHSIHTARLWAGSETKKIANNWNVEAFFMVTHTDVVNCLLQLNNLRLADHTVQIEKGGLGVHVEVCSLMRAKLLSEVKANRDKLKETPGECVKCLAKVCRTISLANLQMIFPPGNYWKENSQTQPDKASAYVEKYLGQILTPILVATDDHVISNMILQIMCEAWLDHIYLNKIKFSAHGACQLLCDFAHIETWLTNCPVISHAMRKRMLKNEILRRCEGVGRLLLRCPGEQIKMVDKNNKSGNTAGGGSPCSDTKTEMIMPAEMYVPNQEQWLELRALKKRLFFRPPLCCSNN